MFCLTLTLISSFCGLFLCLWFFVRAKKCFTGDFRTHGFDLKLLKQYLYFVQKSTFFQRVSPWFLAKNDQIFKSAFFICFCPKGSHRVKKIHWESFLSENNALTKNFLFNFHPDVIFCGQFVCPLSLGRSKNCLKGHFQTHLID